MFVIDPSFLFVVFPFSSFLHIPLFMFLYSPLAILIHLSVEVLPNCHHFLFCLSHSLDYCSFPFFLSLIHQLQFPPVLIVHTHVLTSFLLHFLVYSITLFSSSLFVAIFSCSPSLNLDRVFLCRAFLCLVSHHSLSITVLCSGLYYYLLFISEPSHFSLRFQSFIVHFVYVPL